MRKRLKYDTIHGKPKVGKEEDTMIACGISDIGQIRKENQDYFVNCTFSDQSCLAVVCDGMGGLAGGREASRIAGDAFVASFSASLPCPVFVYF